MFESVTYKLESLGQGAAFGIGTTAAPNFGSSDVNRCFIVAGGGGFYARPSSLFRRSEAADEDSNSGVAIDCWRGRHRILWNAEASSGALSLPVLRNLQESAGQREVRLGLVQRAGS